MRAGLIGQDIRHDAALHHFRQNIGAIPDETDGERLTFLARRVDQLERFVERARDLVAIAALQSLLDPRGIDVDAEKKRTVHGRGQRLRAAHSAESAGDNKFSFERSAEMFAARFGESFERSLHDSLAADVNPRAGRHLAIHGESHALEPVEFRVVRPVADQIRIRDQDARRFVVRAKNADRFAGLDEQCLVVLELAKRSHNRIERLPTPRRPTGAAVNNQLIPDSPRHPDRDCSSTSAGPLPDASLCSSLRFRAARGRLVPRS